MRKRCWLIFIVFVTDLVLVQVVWHPWSEKARAGSETQTPPGEIILKVPGGGRVFMKTFTHQEHVEDYGIACKECHHIYDDGENIWEEGMPVQKCAECHRAEDLGVETEEVTGLLTKQLLSNESCGKCHRAGRGD